MQSEPVLSKSYFLAFSKEGKIKLDEAQRIWSEIARLRDDKSEMASYLKKY